MTSLDSIVRSHIANEGKNTLHGYLRYMKWAIDCLKDIHQDFDIHDKVKTLKLDKKKAAKMPDDLVDWVSLGVKIGDRIAEFVPDNTIAVTYDTESGYKKKNPAYREDVSTTIVNFFDLYLKYGTDHGWSMVAPHNGVGYFTVNPSCREFQFSSEVQDQDIILTYKSSGFDANTESKVDQRFEQLIQEYIRWQEARRKFGDNSGETQMRRKEYFEERDNVLRRISDFSYSGLRDIINRTSAFNKDTGRYYF